jgi:hypothetical protein
MKKARRFSGLLLIMLSITIIGVSAYVYEQASQTITQTIVDIATLTLKNSALGNLNEGETQTYTQATIANLGDAVSLTTTTANVYLHLDSDLDSLTGYSTYNIVVKFSQVAGSTYSVGDTACTLSIASPDYSSIDLDAAGNWAFDFEITTTAGSVSSDTPSTVTIVVSAESTS